MKKAISLGAILAVLCSLSIFPVEKQVTNVAEYVPIGTNVVVPYTV